MHIIIMKIKNGKKITNLSFKFKNIIFKKYNYINKIFLKIYFKIDLKCFHSIIFRILLLYCHQINEE